MTLVVPGVANALSVGKLELQSALNQPLKARIKLLSATAVELDSLSVSLANQDAFNRTNIKRTFLLTRLRFEIQETEEGSDYIKIHSSESIQEPFLNFLLEINWSKGRLFREYTVLLDPPVYAEHGSKKKIAIQHPTSTPDYKPYDHESLGSYVISGEYGPAVTGDTLWSIATAARSGTSVSIQQMMLAILNANPEAFIENNINGLKRGAILQIPDTAEIDFLNKKDVLAQVNSQHALWDEYKGRISTHISQQSENISADSQYSKKGMTEELGGDKWESVTDTERENRAELRLISETDKGSGGNQMTKALSEANTDALNTELVLANESIEALFLENAELKNKLLETDGIIDDLKRLIVLKENELAALQEQIMVAAAQQQESAETVVELEAVSIEPKSFAEEDVVEEIMALEDSGAEDGLMGKVMVFVNEGTGTWLPKFVDMAMAVFEKAKAQSVLVASIVGGLLLLFISLKIFLKRRNEYAEEITFSEDKFHDFDDESATIIADLEDGTASPEDETELPEDEDETVLPDIDAFDVSEEAGAVPEKDIAKTPEDDPMEGINIFLAYEHFDEAEASIRSALENDPDNMDFHNKLLEVFYVAGNKKSYEEAARVIYKITDGQGELWDMATVMWQEMSPNRALFEMPAVGEDEEVPAESAGGGVLNITSDDDMDSSSVDATPIKAEGGNDLDLSLDSDVDMSLSDDASNELLEETMLLDTSNTQPSQETEEVLELPPEDSQDSGSDEFVLDIGSDDVNESADLEIDGLEIDDLGMDNVEPEIELNDDTAGLDAAVKIPPMGEVTPIKAEGGNDLDLSLDSDVDMSLSDDASNELLEETMLLDTSNTQPSQETEEVLELPPERQPRLWF